MDAFLALGRLQREQSGNVEISKEASTQCTTVPSTSKSLNVTKKKTPAARRYVKTTPADLLQQGLRGANSTLLSKAALQDPDNPITHSKTGERTLVIQSCASGHQTSNSNAGSAAGGSWALHRNAKLAVQAQAKTSSIFEGVACYINGYTGTEAAATVVPVATTPDGHQFDPGERERARTTSAGAGAVHGEERTWSNEMIKDAIEQGGGVVRINFSARISHVLISTGLSASKTQKVLTARLSSLSSRIKFVDPRWVVESVLAGRRLSETKFPAPIFNESQPTVVERLGGRSTGIEQTLTEEQLFRHRFRHPATYESAADIAYAAQDGYKQTTANENKGLLVPMRRSRSTSALAELARTLDAEAAALASPVPPSPPPHSIRQAVIVTETRTKQTSRRSSTNSSVTPNPFPNPSKRASRQLLRPSRSLNISDDNDGSMIVSEGLTASGATVSCKPTAAPVGTPVLVLFSSGGQESSKSQERGLTAIDSVKHKGDEDDDAWDMPPSAQPCKRQRKR